MGEKDPLPSSLVGHYPGWTQVTVVEKGQHRYPQATAGVDLV